MSLAHNVFCKHLDLLEYKHLFILVQVVLSLHHMLNIHNSRQKVISKSIQTICFHHIIQVQNISEQIVINANDNDYYRTCAIRIPGMYGTFADGTPDNVLIGPLISGGMSHVPTTFCKSETSLVDFVYVKNAAHVHQLALTSFLEDTDVDVTQICGKTFNCTNDDKLPKDTRENWNVFLYLYHQTIGIKNGEKMGNH